MHPIRQFFVAQYKKVARWQAKGFGDAVFQLERIYTQIHQNNKATLQDGVKATRQYLLAHVYLADFYFLLFGLTVLAFSTRAFAEPGIDYGPWRPVVISLAGLLAGVIPLVMTLVIVPLHVFFHVGMWMLTLLNIVASAVIFSFIEPVIPNYFYHEGVLHFKDLIGGMLVFYGLSLSYLQIRINKQVCYRKFRLRHAKTAIGELVPADKRGPLVALSAQDHYVNIITKNGNFLNRMSLAEAMAITPEALGLQVHRSHWVAYDAMLSLEKIAERYFLTLQNGSQIPVAKGKAELVEAYVDNR